jgi:hypothetical protein
MANICAGNQFTVVLGKLKVNYRGIGNQGIRESETGRLWDYKTRRNTP